ncbi:MAG: tRNA uridine-5-carboxymethylaminomethyl(34) synthesis GTPase MnmE [Spirochaetes bacterium]|jgi:tRNA modification GTPase|nr:tRNA uridine-5-carboxymethylaminomethyl(34) synthesis GTPase MnmE [Spirochaetota bacterium]
MDNDIICAPATSPFNSALAIIRVSGTGSDGIARRIFQSNQPIEHRKSLYGSIHDSRGLVDDVMLTWFKAPFSFTGEETFEVSCHGNPLIVQRIMMLLLSFDNVRFAEPGEFTRRAFLNGKMDLTEAQAVNAVIQARSDWEIDSALDQMHGSLKREVIALKEVLILLRANIEAAIDFSQENISFVTYSEALIQAEDIKTKLESLHKRCSIGERISHGIVVAIIGKPNVGKSSILNYIINAERSIVSDIPGTTRDIIRESIQMRGIHLNLVDTAGIRNSEDVVEKIGIERSKKALADADIILVVFDQLTGVNFEDETLVASLPEKKMVALLNKSDIQKNLTIDQFSDRFVNTICFSAITGEGLDKLEECVESIVLSHYGNFRSSFVADIRIVKLLEQSKVFCKSLIDVLENEEPEEIVAFEIRQLIDTLKEITGEISTDDILESIFTRFCIGK